MRSLLDQQSSSGGTRRNITGAPIIQVRGFTNTMTGTVLCKTTFGHRMSCPRLHVGGAYEMRMRALQDPKQLCCFSNYVHDPMLELRHPQSGPSKQLRNQVGPCDCVRAVRLGIISECSWRTPSFLRHLWVPYGLDHLPAVVLEHLHRYHRQRVTKTPSFKSNDNLFMLRSNSDQIAGS